MSAEAFLSSHYISSCTTYGKWTTFEQLGEPSRRFAQRFHIEHLDWRDWPHPPSVADLIDSLQGEVACVANLQHVHFGNIDSEIAKLAFRSVHPPHLAVHWRRGDFGRACRNKHLASCWPKVARLKEAMQGFEEVAIYSNDKDELIANGLARHYSSDESPGGVFNDMAGMIAAKAFVGNRYSTISRIVRVIREARGMNDTRYF